MARRAAAPLLLIALGVTVLILGWQDRSGLELQDSGTQGSGPDLEMSSGEAGDGFGIHELAPESGGEAVRRVAAEAGAHTEHAELKIVDGEDRALAGARVFMRWRGRTREARTGRDGRVSIRAPSQGAPALVVHAAYDPGTTQVLPRRTSKVMLVRIKPMRVRVRDDSGIPIPGVRIRVRSSVERVPEWMALCLDPILSAESITDEEGWSDGIDVPVLGPPGGYQWVSWELHHPEYGVAVDGASLHRSSYDERVFKSVLKKWDAWTLQLVDVEHRSPLSNQEGVYLVAGHGRFSQDFVTGPQGEFDVKVSSKEEPEMRYLAVRRGESTFVAHGLAYAARRRTIEVPRFQQVLGEVSRSGALEAQDFWVGTIAADWQESLEREFRQATTVWMLQEVPPDPHPIRDDGTFEIESGVFGSRTAVILVHAESQMVVDRASVEGGRVPELHQPATVPVDWRFPAAAGGDPLNLRIFPTAALSNGGDLEEGLRRSWSREELPQELPVGTYRIYANWAGGMTWKCEIRVTENGVLYGSEPAHLRLATGTITGSMQGPIPGISVGHPDFGSTRTDWQGRFRLLVPGGMRVQMYASWQSTDSLLGFPSDPKVLLVPPGERPVVDCHFEEGVLQLRAHPESARARWRRLHISREGNRARRLRFEGRTTEIVLPVGQYEILTLGGGGRTPFPIRPDRTTRVDL